MLRYKLTYPQLACAINAFIAYNSNYIRQVTARVGTVTGQDLKVRLIIFK